MDKSWILRYQKRFSAKYIAGVNSFIDYAKANSGEAMLINCPCNDCCNHRKHDYVTIRSHLHIQGMMVSYLQWIYHGEPIVQPDDSDESEDESEENQDEYDELIEDHRRGTHLEEDTQERDDVQDFENLLKASQRGLYPGCKNSDTLLSFVIKILHVKVESGCSNKSFDKVLHIFKDFLPEGHVVPESVYEAKKLLRDLGMGYKNIDACKHNCVLYWKENAQLDKCPECEEPRYKVNDGKRKKVPHKVLRYFPLTPRLRRLYMSRKTATEMRWHSEKRVDDGIARHPADSVEWKEFDKKYPEFAQETRNVRLGLATDGFNPFEAKAFNGQPEREKNSLDLPGQKVLNQLEELAPVKFGKNNKRPCDYGELNWTKKSILFEWPYWKCKNLRHNLDPMHIEKNICVALVGTILGIKDKNKDTEKAHKDLKNMGIRPELHLVERGDRSSLKPHAFYTLEPKHRDGFYEFLKSIKYPDGYAANLSSFFQDLYLKTQRHDDLKKMEKQIILILCKLEKIFPPTFFDVMVHLSVHLPREAMLGGPVQYRWMYPIERFLKTLKGYVRNRARPEGSIVEAYIVKECLTFCSTYLRQTDRVEQYDDGGERGPGMSVFTQTIRPIRLMPRAHDPSQRERDNAHWFVLNNCPEVELYLHRSQSSGLVMEGEYEGVKHYYYGYTCKVWELSYQHGGKVVLFECEWYNTSTKHKINIEDHVTSIDIMGRWCKDDPFVLPSQDDGNDDDDVPNDAFQQDETTFVVPVLVDGTSVQYSMDDIDPEIILSDESVDEDGQEEDETLVEYEGDEENDVHSQEDDDMEYDI
ncbi:hypothetical protein AAC387_Pa08g2009 [Persea americana]